MTPHDDAPKLAHVHVLGPALSTHISMQDIQATVLPDPGHVTYVNVIVNVTILLAISEQHFDNTGEPGPQAKGVNHP